LAFGLTPSMLFLPAMQFPSQPHEKAKSKRYQH
jgi:hypothetical protein